MDIIDRKDLGVVDGFKLEAVIVPDFDASPMEAECYSPADVEAWKNDSWSYVGTIVTASREGVELGSASLWASEYGWSPGWDRYISPLDGEGDEFVNGYGNGLIKEAIEEAKKMVEKIQEPTVQE